MPPYQTQQVPPMSPMHDHHKARRIVLFLAVLIVIVAAALLLMRNFNGSSDKMTADPTLLDSMTAKGDVQLDDLKVRAIIDSSSASPSN